MRWCRTLVVLLAMTVSGCLSALDRAVEYAIASRDRAESTELLLTEICTRLVDQAFEESQDVDEYVTRVEAVRAKCDHAYNLYDDYVLTWHQLSIEIDEARSSQTTDRTQRIAQLVSEVSEKLSAFVAAVALITGSGS